MPLWSDYVLSFIIIEDSVGLSTSPMINSAASLVILDHSSSQLSWKPPSYHSLPPHQTLSNLGSVIVGLSVMRKEFSRMAKAVTNQVGDNYYRPDLKSAALARLNAVNKSLKVAKSGVKNPNRQVVRISGRK